MANWIHLADFTAKIGEQSITVRVSKTDHPYTPYYSWRLGVVDSTRSPHPNNLMPNMRPDALTPENGPLIVMLMIKAQVLIDDDRKVMKAALVKAESERLAAIAGKSGGDPNAGKGLSRFKKKKNEERA